MPRAKHWALALTLLGPAALAGEPAMTVYKSPTCGCCSKWIEHLEQEGFAVDPIDLRDLALVKSMSGISPEQASCHTARIGGYVIEGHVPASDIRRLLRERPKARGLTVPGMPLGSPGMEAANPQPYQVLLIGEDGSTSVFSEHAGSAGAAK